VCLYSCLIYQAWKSHAPYSIVICGLPACTVPCFSTLYHKRHDFPKKLLNIKYVLIFSKTFFWNISPSKKKTVRGYHKCTLVFVNSTRYSCQILMKIELPRQIFEKSSNIKFCGNPYSGNRVVPCGRADGRTDTTKLTVAFRNFADTSRKSVSYPQSVSCGS
jgi:hypothetical protein